MNAWYQSINCLILAKVRQGLIPQISLDPVVGGEELKPIVLIPIITLQRLEGVTTTGSFPFAVILRDCRLAHFSPLSSLVSSLRASFGKVQRS